MMRLTEGNAIVLTEMIVKPKRAGRYVCPLWIIEIEYGHDIWLVSDLALN